MRACCSVEVWLHSFLTSAVHELLYHCGTELLLSLEWEARWAQILSGHEEKNWTVIPRLFNSYHGQYTDWALPVPCNAEVENAQSPTATLTCTFKALCWITCRHNCTFGVRGGAVGWGTALQAGRSRVRFPMVSLDFFIDIILLAALRPWGRLSL